jgi:hypothetical protein
MVLVLFAVAFLASLVGVVLLVRTKALAHSLVVANLWLYRDGAGTWRMGVMPPPSTRRLRWLQSLEADIERSPGIIWGLRAMGTFAVVIGLAFFAAGLARMSG